jgi:hypothetical protein
MYVSLLWKVRERETSDGRTKEENEDKDEGV